MDIRLKITLEIAVVVYFLLIVRFLRRQTLIIKYSLLWILAGVCMALLILFPSGLSKITGFFGIVMPINGLFMIAFAFVVVILMSLTGIASKQAYRIKELTQNVAIMEKRIRELEKKQMVEMMNNKGRGE